jgi:diguanylate cyclase (GGDEF)-like protein
VLPDVSVTQGLAHCYTLAMDQELGRRLAWSFIWLAISLALSLFPGQATVAGQDERAADFEFDRLSDHLGGRQSTVYEIFEDPFGFVWFAGDTDGLLRFDSEDWVSWSDGLVENNTRSNISTVRVTDNGRLWVGSWGNGLQYWDPQQQTYVQFLPDPADPHALAANRVQRLMIDSQNRLWVGTTAGINLIETGQPNKIRRFAHDQPEHPLYSERIWGMVEHASGFWFATSSGVYRLSPDLSQWTHMLLDESAAERFERGAEVRTVAVAHGQVWAGSQLGVFRWNPDTDELVRVEFGEDTTRSMPRINAILESRSGGVWVGAHDGLYRIDERGPRYAQFDGEYHLIPDVDIRTLYEDSEGSLWIGSRDRGIIQGKRRDRVFVPLAEQVPSELSDETSRLTSAILHDRRGRLWLGVPGGLLRRDLEDRWMYWEFSAATGVRRIEGLAEGVDGTVWIATDSGLFQIGDDEQLLPDQRLFEALGIATVPVNAILSAADGTLWLGLWNVGIVRWDPQDNRLIRVGLEVLRDIRADLVYQISRDPSGALWAATRYSGVFRLEQDRWENVAIQYNGQAYAPSFYCVHHQPPSHLWLCTEDGLLRYRLDNGQAMAYSTAHGLPANRVTGMIGAPDTGLWVLTTLGVARRMPDEDRFVSYGLADGLPGLALQRNALGRLPDGRIVMGTSDGAAIVDPNSSARGLNAPRTVLSRIWLEGRDLTRTVNPAQLALQLPYRHRDLLLQFAVLDFHEPERNLARYRLRGYESEFSELSGDRTARFMNLPPGEYVLEVEGWSSRGVPGKTPLEIPIQVEAPWWYSPVAWVAGILLLASLIWLTIRLRLRALNLSNERLQALVAEQTAELASANEQLRASSARDFLTGLLNRRGFTERFAALQQHALRANSELAVVLFDLDHFKGINDAHGHDVGDETLRTIGRILSETLRGHDLAARWGGEEFLLALPDTGTEGAVQVCEKIRRSFAEAILPAPAGQTFTITATFGVVSRQGCRRPLEAWVKAADEALYRGKNEGRDQIRANTGDAL